MSRVVMGEQRGEECLHAPGASDRPQNGSSLLAVELVPSIATPDGTSNSPRVAVSTCQHSPMRCPTSAHVACVDVSSPPREKKDKSQMEPVAFTPRFEI